jgi:tripartite ATP-independent transporter DctM subunit
MEWIWGVLGIVVFLILLFLGMPIAFSAIIGGIIGFFLACHNFNIAGTIMASLLYTSSSTYAMTVIPLFIFMGYLAYYCGMGEDIYKAARSWFGWLPGGLAIATVMSCAFFGAICGVSTVAVAMFGKMSVPEMDKADYHWSLSVGSVAASGTLADLIPPSGLMVIYAMLAQQPVGKLLIAGFIPGIVSAIIYALMIWYRSVRNPRLGPKGPTTSLHEKFGSLKGIIVVFIVMVIIIGGLYSGFFTPTEVGAWSAFIILIAGVILKRFSWPMLKDAFIDTARTTCMIFVILIGIKVMTTALISSGAFGAINDFFQAQVVPPYLLLFYAIIIYVILGAFVGVMGMLVMTVPVIVPILAAAGFDPIWLGVIVIKFCEIGLITPPIGGNVFVIALVTGRDVGDCFKAILWFLVMDLLTLGVFIAFPQIVMFLPSQMK